MTAVISIREFWRFLCQSSDSLVLCPLVERHFLKLFCVSRRMSIVSVHLRNCDAKEQAMFLLAEGNRQMPLSLYRSFLGCFLCRGFVCEFLVIERLMIKWQAVFSSRRFWGSALIRRTTSAPWEMSYSLICPAIIPWLRVFQLCCCTGWEIIVSHPTMARLYCFQNTVFVSVSPLSQSVS